MIIGVEITYDFKQLPESSKTAKSDSSDFYMILTIEQWQKMILVQLDILLRLKNDIPVVGYVENLHQLGHVV